MIRMARKGATIFAHGATWDFNPKESQERYAEQYESDPIRTKRDYEAIPPETVQGALQDISVIERLCDVDMINPITVDGGFEDWFIGDPMCEYYFHGDLSKSRDATGLALCHYDVESGKVVVDLIWQLVPDQIWQLSFERIVHIIFSLVERGFRIVKATFDGWQSLGTIERLQAAHIDSEVYSVDRGTEAYDTLIGLLLSKRLRYPRHEVFFREFKQLKLLDGKKYNHPEPHGSKDCSDAVAAAVTNCTKARIGLSVGKLDLEGVTHEEHVLEVETIVTESGATAYSTVRPPKLDSAERNRNRTIRIDTAGESILFLMGWYYDQEDRHYLDEFLIWDRFDAASLDHLDHFVQTVVQSLRISAFSLGAAVPIEILTIAQRTGRPVSTPFNVKVPGQHNHVAQSTVQVDSKIARMCLEHVRRKAVSLPRSVPLFKDMRHATDDTLQDRPYLCAFAAWWDFAAREAKFGRIGRSLPSARVSEAAPLNSSVRGSGQGRPTNNEVDRIRQTTYTGSRPAVVGSSQSGSGSRSLPRSRRV